MNSVPDSEPILPVPVPSSLRLLAIWEGGYASCIVPDEGRIVIGRAPTADLRVASNSVSREHAVVIAGEPPIIQDLWSTNGTRVDGRRIDAAEAVPLIAGRAIEVGNALLVLQDSNAPLQHARASAPEAPTLPPSEGKMERLHRLIELAATVSLHVTLQGEPSVGKERIARRIHQRSPRAHRPFLKVNCAKLKDSMIGSELLGQRAPGATPIRSRLFAAAAGGTVFFEEVTALSLAMQAELLRALGDAEVLHAARVTDTPLDVRVISSTSGDFGELVARGAFRSDLYYWLDGIHLQVPPLRERGEEILRLARQFLDQASAQLGLPAAVPSEAGAAWLRSHPWPSNLGELREVMFEAATAAAPGPIEVEHLEQGLALAQRVTWLDSSPISEVPSSVPESEPLSAPLAPAECTPAHH